MKTLALAGILTFALLVPSATKAHSDCHLDMKDMLQGTLDMEKLTDDAKTDNDGSHGCTLAGQQREPSLGKATLMSQLHVPTFIPSA